MTCKFIDGNEGKYDEFSRIQKGSEIFIKLIQFDSYLKSLQYSEFIQTCYDIDVMFMTLPSYYRVL